MNKAFDRFLDFLFEKLSINHHKNMTHLVFIKISYIVSIQKMNKNLRLITVY